MDFNSILNNNKRLFIALGLAVVVALMTTFWLWSQQPEYRVLFSNLSNKDGSKDGGSIIAALEQMNIPYKVTEGSSAIMVPASLVNQTRLKIAAMGLPKGGNVGFELLENQKFGVSQFVEHVNFQRALEGELEKSIQAIDAVQVARVHLAIPKSNDFVHEKQLPTASVLLNLNTGYSLNEQQISAVVHLVASAVPELTATNVTVVDQSGNLLSDTAKKNNLHGLDTNQLKYIEDLQQSISMQVESIITPIVGASNVHAKASVDVDFANVEQADEIYKPNQKQDETTIRSMQSNESQSSTNSTASGVPGALSNQPPANATAPLTTDSNANAANSAPTNSQKNITTNYEVNKTISYSQKNMGSIKRLSLAVVVNNKQLVDPKGKISYRPLNDAEKQEISDLAKQAMGFSEARGDTISVVNSTFINPAKEVIPELPVWKNQEYINLAKELMKFVVGLIVLFVLYRKAVKPMVLKLTRSESKTKLVNERSTASSENHSETSAPTNKGYKENLDEAKLLAQSNPKAVASVVTSWANQNE